jgi:hypothetical protein
MRTAKSNCISYCRRISNIALQGTNSARILSNDFKEHRIFPRETKKEPMLTRDTMSHVKTHMANKPSVIIIGTAK